MFKRINNHNEALAEAVKMSRVANVPIDVCSVFHNGKIACVLLASPSTSHLLPKFNRCHPVSGFYFGGIGYVSIDEYPELNEYPESDTLDIEFEQAYWLVACHTSGNTEQRTAIARLLVKNKTCVWHECARYYGHLATCACGSCEKARGRKLYGA